MSQVPPSPQPPAPVPPGAPALNPGRGLSIAGMVLGIVALGLFCIWYIAIPCAIVGLVLSIIGKNKSVAAGQPYGMAKAGIILSIVALAVDVLIAILALTIGLTFLRHAQQQMHSQQSLLPLLRSLIA